MADVLSQQQIDELLNSFSTQGEKAFEEIEDEAEKKIKNYDFKTPKKFTKEKLKIIEGILENYARTLSSYLTGLMRIYCKVEVLQIEEQHYYEFNNALPDYVMMGLIDMGISDEDVLEMSVIMQLSNPITFTIMDRLMGGSGAYTEITRDFTELEVGLMTNVMTSMAELLKEPWGQYIDIDPGLTNVETNSRVMQSIPPDEVIVLGMFEIEIKDVKNTMSICIPAMNLESVMSKFSDKWARNTKRLDPNRENERRQSILDNIKDSGIRIDAVLCETDVDLYDILTLQVDDVIPLNMPIDENVTVKVGGSRWFDGKLGIYNNRKAIKIDNIYKELR
ncbi:MAG: flagellar motor switch protein FliM [Oscillospiraceae bacterium]|nr:flagellar motor switch protein FliM [Oscillospiraceae bacterium]MDD7429814.1 flagellar motor switch protein FliM [Oscillospiraceae bacterium]MDY2846649.1 flagellar motor switch protein FliM [Oscillospiraceae bacterium]